MFEELFAVEGYREIRRMAAERLAVDGSAPGLYLWLGLGHMAEDEDDHDAAAERAFRRGLELAPDDVDLIAAYAELCLRADEWDYPGRAKRGVQLVARLQGLATGSPQDQHIQEVLAWHRRGYMEDFRLAVVEARKRRAMLSQQGSALGAAGARRSDGDHDASATQRSAGTVVEQQEVEVAAATAEEFAGRANAPLRWLAANRAGGWIIAAGLSFVTNTLLRTFGVVEGFALWGFLWFGPLLILDRRLAAARERARQSMVDKIVQRDTRGPGNEAAGSGP
ncbi:hypothetical protein ABZ705_17145 [Streptomyces sp. NPDC006984]|uniref:hypothetical protein n=1 Tax=Streptomyces sp. NPDC006984 TaxID=3155463 RepID=UPI0033C7A47E